MLLEAVYGGCSLFFVLPLETSLLSSASEQGLGRLVVYLRMLQPQSSEELSASQALIPCTKLLPQLCWFVVVKTALK